MNTKSNPLFSAAHNPFLAALESKNPFAAEPVSQEVPADAPEGSYTYQLVPNGPAVASEECESQAQAVDVMIKWGTTVLHVAELCPPRSFFVGESDAAGQKSDFFLPAEKLGAARLPVVLADASGDVRLVIPSGATGSVTFGAETRTVAELLASGSAMPCAELPGAVTVALPADARVSMEVAGISFELSTGHAGKKAGRFSLKGDSLPYTGLSFLLHAGLLAATALFVPSMAMADEENVSEDQRYMMMNALQTTAERELAESKEDAVDTTKVAEAGQAGERAKGEEGKAGAQNSKATGGRFGIEGKSTEVYLGRTEALKQAQTFGMIGILSSMEGANNSPVASWGRDLPSGNDDKNALGNMWGKDIGESGGAGGLGLTGIGEGGGQSGEGVGLSHIGTIGHDLSGNSGHSRGFLRNGTHTAKSPSLVRIGTSTVSGHLPPEVIQRVVRQNFGRFKACYESGLRNNPSLQGRVSVRFVIGTEGSVGSVANGGSDLPDAGVVSCVQRAFYGLSFPAPESGIVTVSYPIVFSPAN